LVTGIANPKPLIEFYDSLGFNFTHMNYPDHHNFTKGEIDELKKHKLIITTEKDDALGAFSSASDGTDGAGPVASPRRGRRRRG